MALLLKRLPAITEVLYGWYSEKQARLSDMRPTSVRYWTPSGEKVRVTCVSPTMDHGMGYDDMVFVGEVTKMAEQSGITSESDLISDIRSWHPPGNYSSLHKDGIELRTIKEVTNHMLVKPPHQSEDILILSKAVLVLSRALDNFVGECIDESGQAKAPDRAALVKVRAMLPPACKHALTKKV